MGVVFLLYLAVLLVFDHPVRVAADTLAETPLKAFATGLMVLLVLGPIVLLLAASVIGLLVVPVVLCMVFVGGLIGKIAVAQVAGQPPGARGRSTAAFCWPGPSPSGPCCSS